MQKMSATKTSRSEKQLDEFFLNNSEMYQLCVGIQLCLIAGWKTDKVKIKLINHLRETNKTEWKKNEKTINKIFQNIIEILNSPLRLTVISKRCWSEVSTMEIIIFIISL